MQETSQALVSVDEFEIEENGSYHIAGVPGVFDRHGLILPAGLPFTEYEHAGEYLSVVESGVAWAWGDYILYGEGEYGERYAQASAFSGKTPSTLYQYERVAKAFPRRTRVQRPSHVTWKHHQVVAAMPPDEARQWLDRVEENEWSISRLRAQIQLLAGQAEEMRDVEAAAIAWEMDAASFLEGLDPQSADLLLTDPPYMTDLADVGTFARGWLPAALATLKPSARAYICIGAYPPEIAAYMEVINEERPGWLRQILVWTYRNTIGPSSLNDYVLNWQAILYLRGPDAPSLGANSIEEQWAVQDVTAPDGRHGNRVHEWQKPDDLAERFVVHATQPGHTVVDPFAGSGTFLSAAARLGRHALGCDVDPDALAICEERGIEVRYAG